MDIRIYDVQYDDVIKSYYLTAGINYKYALNKLVPLIDKLEFQRNPLRASFYKRLEEDIQSGCIMPNITVAIKINRKPSNKEEITEQYLDDNMKNAFILDGIQRLNTLNRIDRTKLDLCRTLYCNILISDSMDRLLYRMITLNNGQKPMSARHQIEILAGNIFDFESLPILGVTEKEKKIRKRKDEENMNKESLIKGYLAYISNSINIDNQKIIEEKMNELIADKILNSNIADKNGEFQDVINFISKMLDDDYLNTWFKIVNNFIGFSAAMNLVFTQIQMKEKNDLRNSIELFEEVFSAIDVSKVKLGLARRRMVKFYFENYIEFSEYGYSELLDIISQEL
ncbi:MAG: hypothetical protein HFI75_00115 [Lachnospiraceae bacterium]|nr:hypothetical protein [Lachnospiraceae bacterium]